MKIQLVDEIGMNVLIKKKRERDMNECSHSIWRYTQTIKGNSLKYIILSFYHIKKDFIKKND